jgi:hypothetical protein
MSESTEQQTLIQWFNIQYPQYFLIAYPNGQWVAGTGKLRYALIRKYKAEGMKNGVSDLFLCVRRAGYGGLWLEMKDRGKKASSLSKDQRQWLSDMREAGYMAEWAPGFDEAREVIERYLELTL